MNPELLALNEQGVLVDGPLLPLARPKLSTPRSIPPQVTQRTSTSFVNEQGWQVETFIVPAAYPRAFGGQARAVGAGMMGGPPDGKLDVQREWTEMYRRQLRSGSAQRSMGEMGAEEEQLFITVNRYYPATPLIGQGLTLVFAHANGFSKEIWEPTISSLLQEQGGMIEEIWALDCVNQGAAAVLNEEDLGNTFNWAENGRDILNFVISYLDSQTPHTPNPGPSTIRTLSPVHLTNPTLLDLDPYTPPPFPHSILPLQRRYRTRTIVGIGHSLGGGGMAFAASAVPSLFAGIVLVDPVVVPLQAGTRLNPMAGAALSRRDAWSSRDEARAAFLKKDFFRAWDTRILEIYVRFGLREMDGGGLTLTTRKMDEALVFADPNNVASRRCWSRLALLPRSLPTHFIFADLNRSVIDEVSIEQTVRQVGHCTFVRMKGAGHLVPLEQPGETGRELGRWLVENFRDAKGKL